MATFSFVSEMKVSVITNVNADTLEEAQRIAAWRVMHFNRHDREGTADEAWVVDSAASDFAGPIIEKKLPSTSA